MNQQTNSFNKGGVILPPDLEMPKGHEKYSLQDKEKCPYFQISEKTKDITTNIPANKSKFEIFLYIYFIYVVFHQDEMKNGRSSMETTKKKEKKPKSGCPFMPSETKKNPGLSHFPESYEYFNYFL